MNRELFLFVEPYVYTSMDLDKALLYNTLTGKYILLNSMEQEIREFLNDIITSPTRSVKLCGHPNGNIKEIISRLRVMHMCDIIEGAMPFVEPMNCKVLFNKSQVFGNYKRIISWVNQLNIVSANGQFTDIDVFVNRDKYNSNEIFELEQIKEFFSKIYFEKLKEIDYIGMYNSIEDIGWVFEIYQDISFSFHVNYRDVIIKDLVEIRQLCKDFRIVLCFDQTVELKQLKNLVKHCKDLGIEVKGCFLAKNHDDLVFLKSTTFDFEIIVLPLFNNNYDFFIDNVCLSETDILTQKLTQENILTNMTVNSNFFGELILMPDNQIYTNYNSEPIGKPGNDWRIILDNLSNSSWFLTREKLEPCKQCAFHYICPPPSDYELAIKKPNLCTVKS